MRYVCPKRGAVHYHLLTNLDIDKDPNIIIPQKENNKILKNRYDVKGWTYGFSRVDKLKDIKVVAYLSKYMTKESDNRLYCHRRYLNSTNLKRPTMSYLNLNDIKSLEYLDTNIKNRELTFSKQYYDYFGEEVNFFEYRTQHNMHYAHS